MSKDYFFNYLNEAKKVNNVFESDDDNEADVYRVDDVVRDKIIKLKYELRDELITTEKLNEIKKKGT